MDKKTQKRVSLLRERVQRLNRVLAGVKAQTDEPDEVLIDRHNLKCSLKGNSHDKRFDEH